jgi:hypothetical protein
MKPVAKLMAVDHQVAWELIVRAKFPWFSVAAVVAAIGEVHASSPRWVFCAELLTLLVALQ